ncbi:MAG TPA: nuclear transport factor 2 family protein [Candidatus Binataceae bacterium]|nr:nuclear transport factor 2 family protein [Candidatus Binataceae bacterium]
MTDIEKLVAIEAVRQTKARYFRLMDTKDWEGFAAVFAPDATVDYASENPAASNFKASGAANIVALVRQIIGEALTIHHGHMAEVEILTPTTARAVVAMEDLIFWPAGARNRTLHGWGHYHETYERVADRWLIKSLKLTRLRVENT